MYYSESISKGHSKENWLPVGSFTSLVGYVQNARKWLIHDDEQQKPACLHRNCIQFNLPANQPGVVTLVDKYTHLEVYLIIDKAEACGVGSNVRNTILSGMKEVNKCLKHTDAVLETGFICSQHKHQKSQIATVNIFPQLRLVCNNKRTSDKLTEKQTPWFKDEQLLAMAAMPSSQQGMQHQSVTHKERLPTQHQPMQPQSMQHQYQSMQPQPMPSSREMQQQSMKCKERLPRTEDRPTLPELIDFKTSTGSIKIIKCIGTHYDVLGTLLLQDNDGTVTQAIRDQYHHDAAKINYDIMRQWIQGKGRQPVQWSTLIDVLKKIELSVLAKKIEDVLKRK